MRHPNVDQLARPAFVAEADQPLLALQQLVKSACRGDALAQPLEQAFSDATRRTGIAAAAFILIGLASSFLLPRPRRADAAARP